MDTTTPQSAVTAVKLLGTRAGQGYRAPDPLSLVPGFRPVPAPSLRTAPLPAVTRDRSRRSRPRPLAVADPDLHPRCERGPGAGRRPGTVQCTRAPASKRRRPALLPIPAETLTALVASSAAAGYVCPVDDAAPVFVVSVGVALATR